MSWDPYLDLRTGVLHNRLGITDPAELARIEADFTSARIAQLWRHRLPGRYDLAHLQRFHQVIFGDVFEWVGELRTVSLGKGGALLLDRQARQSPTASVCGWKASRSSSPSRT